MAKGIFGTIGLAATLVFAIPVAVLGLQFIVIDGRPAFGVGFLLIAALMIAIEEYLTTPTDLPGLVFGKTVGAAVTMPDEDEGDTDGNGDGRADGESGEEADTT